MGEISDALTAFGKGITEGSGKDIKGLSQSELSDYKKFVKTLTPEQKKAEQSKVSGMNQAARNKFIRRRIANFGSATTKEVERQGGQNKEGALAKGGKVRGGYKRGGRVKMAGGGKACRGRKANYKA